MLRQRLPPLTVMTREVVHEIHISAILAGRFTGIYLGLYIRLPN